MATDTGVVEQKDLSFPQDQLPEQEQEMESTSSPPEDVGDSPPSAEPPSVEPDAVPEKPAAPEEAAETKDEFFGIREVAGQFGLDLSGYPDDESAIRALASQVQRSRELESYYQQQQQQLAAAESQKKTEEEPAFNWDPPEFQSNWLSQVNRDEDGQLVPNFSAGGTPETVAKIQRYLQFRQDQQEKFWSDPFQFMQSFVDTRIGDRARELVDSAIKDHGNQQYAQNFIDKNRDWIFQKDAQGNPVMVNGYPTMSPEGQAFKSYIDQAAGWNLPLDAQEKYAMDMMKVYRTQNSQAQQAADNNQRKQAFLENAAGHQANEAASTNQSPGADGQTPPQNSNFTLEQLMRQNLKAAGITDEDVSGAR